jgi:hypothetical protein
MATKPVSIRRQRQAAKVMMPVSSSGHVLRIENRYLWTPNDTGLVTVQRHTYPYIENGHRNRQTTYECFRNIPPVFRHLETPHVSGKRLLGACQMAGGIFLIKRQSSMTKVATPLSSDVLQLRFYKSLNVAAERSVYNE